MTNEKYLFKLLYSQCAFVWMPLGESPNNFLGLQIKIEIFNYLFPIAPFFFVRPPSEKVTINYRS